MSPESSVCNSKRQQRLKPNYFKKKKLMLFFWTLILLNHKGLSCFLWIMELICPENVEKKQLDLHFFQTGWWKNERFIEFLSSRWNELWVRRRRKCCSAEEPEVITSSSWFLTLLLRSRSLREQRNVNQVNVTWAETLKLDSGLQIQEASSPKNIWFSCVSENGWTSAE